CLEAARCPETAHRAEGLPGLVVVPGEDRPPRGHYGARIASRRLHERVDDLAPGLFRFFDAGDQPVGMGPGERRRLGAPGGHPDGDGSDRWAVETGLVGCVVLAFEVELLAGEQPMHDLECFLHAGDALGVTGEGKTERALVEVLTRPDSEDESATRQT